MSTLKFFRPKILRRHIVSRFLCTESSNNGENPENKKMDTKLPNAKPTKIDGDAKKTMGSLLTSLQQSQGKKLVESSTTVEFSKPSAKSELFKSTENVKQGKNSMSNLLQTIKRPDVTNKENKEQNKTLKENEIQKKTLNANEEQNKKAHQKDKVSNLLKALEKSTVQPLSFDIETAIPRKMPEIERKHIKEDPKIIKAVNDVAKHYGGDQEKIVNELHTRIKSHSVSGDITKNLLNMSVMERPKEDPNELRTHEMYPGQGFPSGDGHSGGQDIQRIRPRQAGYHDRGRSADVGKGREFMNILSMQSLDIFPPLEEWDTETSRSQLTTWDKCSDREILANTIKAPKNAFEEMIRWTDSGRMWKFPVDNEIGMVEEKKYTFADHIFLDRHLEPWCPKTGPIRHFMHLVCSGMSQNPFIGVKRKLAHIQWYQEYFAAKENRDLLLQSGLSKDMLVEEDAPKLDLVNLKDFTIVPLPKLPDTPTKKSKYKLKHRGLHARSHRQMVYDKKHILKVARSRRKEKTTRTFKFL